MVNKPFRLLITGSRDWPEKDAYWILRHLDAAFAQTLQVDRELIVVHGHCLTGVDAYADFWCEQVGVMPERHPAKWKLYGRSAGFKRNAEMVNSKPNVCAAFIKNNSAGATHCYMLARATGIETFLARYEATR